MDFAQTLQQPRDARFRINDVEVERPRNENIDDVMNNVSISLKQVTEKPVSFTVDFDKEKIENGIISFISNYNRCISLMIDSQKSKEVTKPGEYEKADRGILTGDITINNIRSRMRSIMMTPYPTSLSNRLALAMQLGISTGRFNSPVDEVRAGLLKFDQELFRKMFLQYPQATAELFGSDTDGNKIIDNGLAFAMNDFLLNVTRPKSGMVNLMVEKTKTDIDSKKKQIKTKEEQVAAYEEKLKIQFLNMERNMSGLKAQQKWMDQQMKNQNKD
jgi:flagellar capping protein FliD